MANEKRLIYANPIVRFIMDGLNNPDKMKALGHDAIEVLAEIEFAPTVDAVEVVHAEWLDGYAADRIGRKVYDSIDCSHCEEVFKIESETREYWKARFKVCPFCGAKMDGGNEDGNL
jgi:hypothetical protein